MGDEGGGVRPYYEQDGIVIYHGDCLGLLSELPVGIVRSVVTDPPFSSGARTDASKSVRGSMLRGARWDAEWFTHDNMATFGFLYLMRLLCLEMNRVCASDASAHMFIDWRMYPNLYGAVESAGWIAKNLVVWDKESFGMGSNYRNQHELILYAEKGESRFARKNVGNVLRAKRPTSDNHPTEKPVSLLRTLIAASTSIDDVVLDPFGGSGSTLVAARSIGRKAIAFEIEERYCEIAAKRLSQGALPLEIGA